MPPSSKAKRAKIADDAGESCMPHPDAIIKAADYSNKQSDDGRRPLPFAIAEKIDNAIAATMGNKGEGRVDVYFLFNGNDNLQNIAIRDNGKGMDRKEAKSYATYAYSHSRREDDGEDIASARKIGDDDMEKILECGPRYSIDGQIGHFGVGGQNSVFFLGEEEHVMTCKAKGKGLNGEKPVTEVVISADRMLKMWKVDRSQVYQFPFQERAVGDASLLNREYEDHPMLKTLITNEKKDIDNGTGFSMFIVDKIKEVHQKELKPKNGTPKGYEESLNEVVTDLARTYHFYLHGITGDEDLPEDLAEGSDDEGVDEDGCDSDDGIDKNADKKRKRADMSAAGSKAKKGNGSSKSNTIKVKVFVHAYKDKEVKFTKSLQDVMTVECELMHKKKATMEVYMNIFPTFGKSRGTLILNYCPKILDVESRPMDNYENNGDNANRAIISSYWQGRWVPYSEIGKLPIFQGAEFPTEYLNRIRGTILFARKMRPISSKLSFIEPPEVLLNKDNVEWFKDWEQEVGGSITALKTAQREVRNWMRECHEEFDREISVEGIIEGEIFKDSEGTPETRFTRMGYGRDQQGNYHYYTEGDKIIFTQYKPHRCGKIKYFSCEKLGVGKSQTGKATIYYQRFPVAFYGEEVQSEPVQVKLTPADPDKWEQTVKKIELTLPHEILVYEDNDDCLKNMAKFKRSSCEGKLYDRTLEQELPAGYMMPKMLAFVVNAEGHPLKEVPTSGKSNTKSKLKILRKVVKLTDEADRQARGGDGAIGKKVKGGIATGIVIVDGHKHTQENVEQNAGYTFPNLSYAFQGAGVYQISFSLPGHTDFKGVKWTRQVTVEPAEPHSAKLEVTKSGARLKLGVENGALKVSFFDEHRDKEKIDTWGNLITKFPKGVKAVAYDVLPPSVSVVFNGYEILKGSPGHAVFYVQVKPFQDANGQKSEISQFKNSVAIQVSCKIMFEFEEKGKHYAIQASDPFDFQLSPGVPRSMVFSEKKMEMEGITCENHGILPEIKVFLRDKWKYRVTLDEGEHVMIEEYLEYVGSNQACKKRVSENPISKKMTDRKAILGNRRIHLSNPGVEEDERHELKISASVHLKGKGVMKIDCKNLDVQITPSTRPCYAEAFHDQLGMKESNGRLDQDEQEKFVLKAVAGSQVTGIYFKLFNEAREEVQLDDVSGWKVKWQGEKKAVACSKGVVMPPVDCRQLVNDHTNLVVTFEGPRDESAAHEARFVVDLTIIPIAAPPRKWCFCDPNDGMPLTSSSINIACDQDIRDVIAFQLRDEFNNVIDITTLGDDIKPKVNFQDDNVGKRKSQAVLESKIGDWRAFEHHKASNGNSIILFRKGAALRYWATELLLNLKTDKALSEKGNLYTVTEASQKINVTAGPPVRMRVTLMGLPNEEAAEGIAQVQHVFPTIIKQEPTEDYSNFCIGIPAAARNFCLGEFPSTSEIQKVEVAILDLTGNSLSKESIKKAQSKASATFRLEEGQVFEETHKKGSGTKSKPKFALQMSKPFNNEKIVFKNVMLSAGRKEDGSVLDQSNIVVSCNIPDIVDVLIPIKFSQMNRVVSISITPDSYEGTFRVGDKLHNKIVVKLHTEDGAPFFADKDIYKKSITATCMACVKNKEEENIFDDVKFEQKDDDTVSEFFFRAGEGDLTRVGEHSIRVKYVEMRPSIIGALGETYIVYSKELKFNVVPGPPHDLTKSNYESQLDMVGAAARVENNPGLKQERMILKRPLELQVRDRYGNRCENEADLCVVAWIEQMHDADDGPDDLSYEVCYQSKFQFANTAEKQKAVQNALQIVDKLSEERKELEKAQSDRNRAFGLCLQEIERQKMIVNQRKGQLEKLNLIANNFRSPEDCQIEIDKIKRQGGHRRQLMMESRKLDDINALREMYGLDYQGRPKVLGFLAELICVEDRREASLIGAKSKRALETIIVQDLITQRDIGKLPQYRGYQDDWLNRRAALNIIDFHNPEHNDLRSSVVFGLIGRYCICNFAGGMDETWEKRKRIKNRYSSRDLLQQDIIDLSSGSQIASSGASGGSFNSFEFVDREKRAFKAYVVPGSRNIGKFQIQELESFKCALDELLQLEQKSKKTQLSNDESEAVESRLREVKRRQQQAMLEYSTVCAVRQNTSTERVASQAGQAEVLPVLEFVGEAPPRPQGAHDRMGDFVFDVDLKGKALVSGLGLKEKIGNAEGCYRLVCMLHKTGSGEKCVRAVPDKRPPLVNID